MFFKIFILLALASAVRTSVIVNVYEYEDGEKASHSLRGGCNYRACDQLCRRLGFKGGACVGDKCECDNFAPSRRDKADYSLQSGCNYRACDQLCRRLGFKGGACVGDRCKCDNFTPLTEIIGENSLTASCTDSVCDQLCQRLGYKSGKCVGHRCKCDNSTEEGVEHLLKSTKENNAPYSFGDCNFQACDQLCRNLGFPGGACVGDRCECDNFKEVKVSNHFITQEDVDENNNEEQNNYFRSSKDQSVATLLPGFCDIVKCNEMCHRMNYIGGTCRAGSCQCF